MGEKQIFWIALWGAIIGLVGLSVISYICDYNLTAIGDIDENYADKDVLIEGVISGLRNNKGVYSFEISDETGKIKGVIFSEELNANNNQNVRAEGSVVIYNGELEINVNRLENF